MSLSFDTCCVIQATELTEYYGLHTASGLSLMHAK